LSAPHRIKAIAWEKIYSRKVAGPHPTGEVRHNYQNGLEKMGSLFEGIPGELPEELIETLCSTDGVKIERIVSKGHATPEGFWYDQDCNEFVLVVQGRAGLKFEGETGPVILTAGDYVNIGSHVRHRVEWTDPARETIWLAVHY
jgi:cupin 2 domain-containing protein